MSLNKAIEHGREHRKPYQDVRSIDSTCRSHGSCPWCINSRKYKTRKQMRLDEKIGGEDAGLLET